MKRDRQGKEANRLFRCLHSLRRPGTPGAWSSRAELVAENGKSVMSTENTSPARPYTDPSIDEYLRVRLMPVEGSITLMSQGDILFLYTDGVYDGSDNEGTQATRSREAQALPAAGKKHLPRISGICSKKRRSFAPDRRTRPHRRQD